MKGRLSVRDLCTIGVFAAVIALLSWVSIPMPLGVPITLQTFAVPLAGVVLGPKRGSLAVAAYVLLGAVGIPVFAGFASGLGVLLGVTGGFIWGFPLMALCAGLGARRGGIPALALGLLAGIVVDYSIGLAQFVLVTGMSPQQGFLAAVAPFLPGEAVKAVLVATAGMKCRSLLIKSGLVTT